MRVGRAQGNVVRLIIQRVTNLKVLVERELTLTANKTPIKCKNDMYYF